MRLVCQLDPRILGIENEAGDWDPSKFTEHVAACEACSAFADLLGQELWKAQSQAAKATAARMTPEQRRERARKGAQARWGK